MAISMGVGRRPQNVNCFGQPIRIKQRLEDAFYWIEERCGMQPDGSEHCELFFGEKTPRCDAIGCSRPAQPGERFCADCASNDYPHH